MKLLYRTTLALAFLLVFATGRVGAHAYLDRSVPEDGETLMSSPREIRAWFTEALVHKVSTLTLVDANGNAVAGTNQQTGGPDMMKLSVPTLAPGTYTAKWQVLSVDTHVTEGSFSFTIAGAPAPPEPEPKPEPQPEPQPQPQQPAPEADPEPQSEPELTPKQEPEPETEAPAPPTEEKPAAPDKGAATEPNQPTKPPAETAPAPTQEPAPESADTGGGNGLLWSGLAAVAVLGSAVWFFSRRKSAK